MNWHGVFTNSASLGVGGFIARAVLTYLVLLILVRAMGQREVAQLTALDFIIAITIGSIFAATLSSAQNGWWQPTTTAIALVLIKIATNWLGMKSEWFNRLVKGEPITIIKDGKIQEDAMRKGMVTSDVLMEELRKRKAFSLADVELAILEPSGTITVEKKQRNQTVTLKDMGMAPSEQFFPAFLVKEGRILHDNLQESGVTEAWLRSQLASMGVDDIGQVFIAQLSTKGSLFIDTFNDEGTHKKDVSKDMILSSLTKLQGDFETFSIETEDQQAKAMYSQLGEQAAQVHQQLMQIWSDKISYLQQKTESHLI